MIFKFIKNLTGEKSREDNQTSSSGKAEESADEQAALNEFYQYFVNRFVYLVDKWRDDNPDADPLLNDWHFKLEDIEWGDAAANKKRVSSRIIGHDQSGDYAALGEFAHGFGDNYEEAIDTGFTNWLATDLPVLADLKSKKAIFCDEVSKSGSLKRGLLGPMQFWSLDGNGPEPCCNSCIFTQTLLADETFLSREKPMLVKAVVCRNPDNSTETDFRINGRQDDQIAASLSKWAESWEGNGFAMRKQSMMFVD